MALTQFITESELKNITRIQQQDLCTFEGFFIKPFVGDFEQNSQNCIYRNECPDFNNFAVIMPVCFTYCFLKCLILTMVLIYQKSRVRGIESQLIEGSCPELKTYKKCIEWNIVIELFMGMRDFLLFRGLGYFISYLYEIVFVYANSSNNSNGGFEFCFGQNQSNSNVLTINPKENVKFYLMNVDICLIRFPFFSLEDEANVTQQKTILTCCIIVWMILDCLSTALLFFNTQVLSQVNEEGKELEVVNKKLKKDSIIFFFCQLGISATLVFVFEIRLYFHFQSIEVLIYYLVWKSLGFMLLLDQYNKKKSLSNDLLIDISYDKKGELWSDKNKQAYEEAKSQISFNSSVTQEQSAKFQIELQSLKNILDKKCETYDKDRDKRIKFRWQTYLFFVLFTLFIGIIGLSCCIVHFAINFKTATKEQFYFDEKIDVNMLNSGSGPVKQGKYLIWEPLYWVGFILCMLESAIFEIFNSVLLLHSYYLELFTQIGQKKNSEIDDVSNFS